MDRLLGTLRDIFSVPLPHKSRRVMNVWNVEELQYTQEEWEEFVLFTKQYLSRYPTGITYIGETMEAAQVIADHLGEFTLSISEKPDHTLGTTNFHVHVE